MEGLHKGGKSYLDGIALISKLRQQWREERAARGLDPQDLGNSTRKVFQFTAEVLTDSTPISAERKAFEDSMDALYPDTTSSVQEEPPAPAKKKASKKSRFDQ